MRWFVPQIDIDDAEFAQLMFILANAEGKGINWTMVNPLMMKIGGQARNQREALASSAQRQQGLPNLGSMAPPAPMRRSRNSGPEAQE